MTRCLYSCFNTTNILSEFNFNQFCIDFCVQNIYDLLSSHQTRTLFHVKFSPSANTVEQWLKQLHFLSRKTWKILGATSQVALVY